jgi:signal transduction histidine kinase
MATLDASATPIEGPSGHPRRALVLLRDVTDRRHQELQLLQAEKMSSIGVLAAGVAHEINNPLTSVGGYAEALLRRRRDDPELRDDARLDVFWDYLAVIMREAHRCKGIIDGLLSLSRKSDGLMTTVELNPLADEVLDLLGFEARGINVEIVRRLSRDLRPVNGDPSGLRQVILNLAINAVQAIEGRGRVTVATRNVGDTVLLEVKDDGCGIAPEHLEQIWNPFFTTKPVGKGLGLGLSLSYNIVRKHRGEISVSTQPGRGTIFTVILPAQVEP